MDFTKPYFDIEIMKKTTSINTMMSSKIRELTALRKSCMSWKQIEIDKQINELQKIKEDVKKCRQNY